MAWQAMTISMVDQEATFWLWAAPGMMCFLAGRGMMGSSETAVKTRPLEAMGVTA